MNAQSVTPEIQLEPVFPSTAQRGYFSQNLPLFLRRIALSLIFALLCLREYDGLPGETKSPLYDSAWAGFRWVDLFLLALFYVHALWILLTRQQLPRLPKSLKISTLLVLGAIGVAFLYGFYQNGEHLYFDWRNALIGAGLAVVFSCWIQRPTALEDAIHVFAWVMGARILYLLGDYFIAGGGVTGVLPGVRTPVYDGPTLDGAVLLVLLAFRFTQQTIGRARIWWVIAGVAAFLLILLSLRRTFWGEMAFGIVIVAILQKNRRCLWAFVLLPGLLFGYSDRFYLRAKSMNPLAERSSYAISNEDHVGDLLDALDVVEEHPVLGIGLGHSYRTRRITDWKTESWEVHNGLLHAWVFYGLLGLIAYVSFHVSLFRWLKKLQATEADPRVRAFSQVGLAYLFGQFCMSCGFTPWFYGPLGTDILIFFVLGSLLSLQRQTLRRLS
jgi:O-antigen ligase